jgi:hypothetical protein
MKEIIKIQTLSAENEMVTILMETLVKNGDRTDRSERAKGLGMVSKMESVEYFKQMIDDYRKSTSILE